MAVSVLAMSGAAVNIFPATKNFSNPDTTFISIIAGGTKVPPAVPLCEEGI